jgi:DNA polymerase-3 subunit gamma/tau
MSYLVLARKYRPQTFSEVVGQEHVTRTLANAFAQGRVHHGFLFCGPRGVGKTTLARILGKALNCVKGPTAEPCGTCEACTSIASGIAVDYIEMDGASNRGIDAIRDLTEAVRYQPAALRKKVYVIDEVHMLTTEAFNALLKTLEEPPPHVTFILATTEAHKVPVTILSRCQRYDFKLVPTSRLHAHLVKIFAAEKIDVEAGAVDLLVRESGGSVRDALSLGDQVISYVGASGVTEAQVAEVLGVADRALTRTLVESVAGGDAVGALSAVEAAITRGLDEVQLARALVRALHDVAVAQAGPGAESIVDGSAEEQAELARLARAIDPGRVRLWCDRMLKACEDLAESPEPRVVLDLALIDLAATEAMPPIGALIDKLAQMEKRLAAGGGGGGGGGDKVPARTAPAAARPAGSLSSKAPVQASGSGPTVSSIPQAYPIAVPSPSPSTSTDPLKAWEAIISRMDEARELTLVSLYQQAKVLGWSDKGVELGFPPGMSGELASEPEKVAALEKFVARPVKVVILSEADAVAARSIVEAEQDRQQHERDRRQSEAREHPLTKMVLDTFGAAIKEIKTDV